MVRIARGKQSLDERDAARETRNDGDDDDDGRNGYGEW